MGPRLLSVVPSGDEYVARFKDVTAKIVLANLFHVKQLPAEQIPNPYFSGVVAEPRGKVIRVSGPLADMSRLRWLRVEI